MRHYQKHCRVTSTEEKPTEFAGATRDGKKIDESRSKSHYCHKPGHWKSECRKRLKNEKKKKDKEASENKTKANEPVKDEQANIAFIHKCGPVVGADRFAWIIDTGATSTMSPNL